MSRRRDPIQRVSDGSRDLYGVVTWERRSVLDGVATLLYRAVVGGTRALVVLLALAIVLTQVALTVVASLSAPALGAYIVLSVAPALGLAALLWRADVTRKEPLRPLVVTFLLGILFAGFAAEFNSAVEPAFRRLGTPVGLVLFFYLAVGPVEETVKWLAIRLYAFRRPAFATVVDGAVYGAMAGLGFATIENALYITREFVTASGVGGALAVSTIQIAAVRSFAGPGHVIYSGFAGYYLGLAKFNPENRGPIVVKGLLVAALIHATYNVSVSSLSVFRALFPVLEHVGDGVLFLGFVLVYDGLFGYVLYRKVARYRETYHETGADRLSRTRDDDAVDRTEFEWDRRAAIADAGGADGGDDPASDSTRGRDADDDPPRDGGGDPFDWGA
ncbi:MAG: PrsW family intramembrane metalloprotease [Halobacteriaceae archaeon]